jgi:hypothetical protein
MSIYNYSLLGALCRSCSVITRAGKRVWSKSELRPIQKGVSFAYFSPFTLPSFYSDRTY